MAKRPEKLKSNNKNQSRHATHETDPFVPHIVKPARTPIEARTKTQEAYRRAIETADLVMAVGPAGTGKTYMPTALAADELAARRISKVIITRPAVEAGESLGFLPGELDEKYEPYLAPVRQILTERLGTGQLDYDLKSGRIEPIPLGFMRGMTFKDCWVIVDEAQNITPKQMKMLLTRIGENCKVILCGDTDQVDIAGPSGLADAVWRMRGAAGVKVVSFTQEDVVRSGLVKEILRRYAKEEVTPGT